MSKDKLVAVFSLDLEEARIFATRLLFEYDRAKRDKKNITLLYPITNVKCVKPDGSRLDMGCKIYGLDCERIVNDASKVGILENMEL